MTTAQHQIPDYTTDDAATYKAKMDANAAVAARIAGAYQAYANSTPNMTVKVAAGALLVSGAVVENAIQTTGTITAPATNPRIDRVVIDSTTGVASVITGAEAGSPVAPTLTAGKLPVAQVALTTSTTAITNSMITDERALIVPPAGVSAASQAEMEAASSTPVYASPGRVKYHPGVAKAWVIFNGTGTPAILANENVSSITDNGIGDFTINFTTAFSSANYGVSGAGSNGVQGLSVAIDEANLPTTSACRIRTQSSSSTTDPTRVSLTFHGDQA